MKALLLPLAAIVTLGAMDASAEPKIYGRYESVRLPELGKTLRAKMDTGAVTVSLSARDIERFERDGDEWVRFRLATEHADDTLYEHVLARVSKIKNRAEETDDDDEPGMSERPVVELEMCLGGERRTVEVNLTDRSHFSYPLLVGAKALRAFGVAIDPAKKNVAGRPEC